MAEPEKTWDPDLPFARVKSPWENNPPDFTAPNKRPDGDGYACGCRQPSDWAKGNDPLTFLNPLALVARKLLRAIPGWVPVVPAREIYGESREVQGTLRRSFQTWTDFPIRQWHRWYDWNFHLEPDPEYAYIRGEGNDADPNKTEPEQDPFLRDTIWDPVASVLGVAFGVIGAVVSPFIEIGKAIKGLFEKDKIWPNRRVVPAAAMECEWDCGAFGPNQGLMFDKEYNDLGGWWPMAGQRVWLRGRWIYDCGHAIENKMRNELHPVLAMASARWEATSFEKTSKVIWPPEAAGSEIGFQTLHLPAIQFLFFTHRSGGYKDYPTITNEGKDYEFIVDLPAFDTGLLRWSLGRTAAFPFNTGTLRDAKLLCHFNFKPFVRARAETLKNNGEAVENDETDPAYKFQRPSANPSVLPKVEIIPPKEGRFPRQVKVTIPVSQMQGVDGYGVNISLGWYDSGNVQAKKVKKCTVNFTKIRKCAVDHDTFAEEWNCKIGVNGRWFLYEDNDVHNNSDLKLNRSFDIYLAEGDTLGISAHGSEIDLVGDFFFDDLEDRWLRGGKYYHNRDIVLDWEQHIVARDSGHDQARRIAFLLVEKMLTTFNDQNDPLGQIDPGMDTDLNLGNPLKIRANTKMDKKPHFFRAFETMEVGDSAELEQDPDEEDYQLHYELTIDTQPLP